MPRTLRNASCVAALVVCASQAVPLHAEDTRVIPMAAYQRSGRFVVGLKPEQLRVKGVAARVQSLELDRSPRRIVILIDASRSMGGDGRGNNSWPYAIQLAKEFLGFVQPSDQVSLHTFAEKHARLVNFTDDVAALGKAIDEIPAPNTRAASKSRGTETNLGLALSEILTLYADSLRVGDTVLLISDGEYKGEEQVPLRKVEPELVARGVRLMLLRIGPLIRQFREPVIPQEKYEDTKRGAGYAASKEMSDLAKQTGGFTVAPWDHAEMMPSGNLIPLKPEVIRLGVQVAYAFARNSYRVELVLSESVYKAKKIELELVDERGKEEKAIEMFYPRILTGVK